MRHTFVILIIVVNLSLNSCGQDSNESFAEYKLLNYQKQLRTFDSSFVKHFPRELESDSAESSLKLNIDNNNVGFFLYEYSLNKNKFESVLKEIQGKKFVVNYSSMDSCILVINSNSGSANKTNDSNMEKFKATKVRPCILDKLPISALLSMRSPKFLTSEFLKYYSALIHRIN